MPEDNRTLLEKTRDNVLTLIGLFVIVPIWDLGNKKHTRWGVSIAVSHIPLGWIIVAIAIIL